MIKHMFKLIWNRKRSNFLMIAGIVISFFAMFAAMTSINYGAFNYFKPLGFSYQDVWILTMQWKNQDQNEIREVLIQIENLLKSFPEVKNFALSECYIFQTLVTSTDEFQYENKKINCMIGSGGDNLAQILDIELLEGRWFNESDRGAVRHPAVLSKSAVEEFFPDRQALGKILIRDEIEYQVVGVIGEFRNNADLSASPKLVFSRLSHDDEYGLRLLGDVFPHRMLLKVSPGSGIELEERLMKQLKLIAKNWTLKMSTMEGARSNSFKTTLIFPLIVLIICGFLIFNVALGLFGVVWYNTTRRRPEIGLRRAMGATANLIYKQILGETAVLTTFGIILGSFFALQFPLLNIFGFISLKVYLSAFVISVALIYLIAAICALYPSYLASKIQPAAALHNE